MELKFENLAQVGDRIRAHDFGPLVAMKDSFVEGTVTERDVNVEGALCYRVAVDRDTTMEAGARTEVLVPYGVFPFEWDERVELLPGEQA